MGQTNEKVLKSAKLVQSRQKKFEKSAKKWQTMVKK